MTIPTWHHSILGLTGDSEIHDRTDYEQQISLEIRTGPSTASLVLPANDADALLVLDLLEAAVSNASSRVSVRQRNREREHPDEEVIAAVPGWNGAGSDTPYGDLEVGRG